MKTVSSKKEILGNIEAAIEKVTKALQQESFGILTRIDLHVKMKEKLNVEMSPVIILGACNPSLAHRAVEKNMDVTSLMPCNVVLRDLGENKISVEMALAKPILALLDDSSLNSIAEEADAGLLRALKNL